MDRKIVYTGQVPLGNDFLNTNKNTMIALGVAFKAILGTTTIFDGLACTPTGPASLQVLVGPGSVYSFANVDGTAYGNLAADTTHQIVKQGIILDTTTLTCTPPSTTGFSTNFLIQATYQDQDVDSAVLPYFNAANPPVAFNGPNNTGVSQNTTRKGALVISLKAGTAAATGTQTTPAPDAGFTGLWVVRVPNGATALTSGNISLYTGSGSATGSTAFWSTPFIAERLNDKVSIATGDLRWQPIGGGGGGGAARTVLSANTTFHVATTGNDSTGDGSSGAPWLTRQHAWNTVQNTYDLAGFNVTFQLSDGTYTDAFSGVGWMVGQFSPNQVIFNGNSVTPTNVLISSSTPFIGENCGYQVQNLKFQNASGGNGIFALNNAILVMGAGLTTGACSGTKIRTSYGGQILINNSYNDVGNAQQHYSVDDGGQIIVIGGITVTLTGTPAYSSAFALAIELGNILFQNVPTAVATFSGSATGPEYIVNSNAVITTQGSGPTYLPGSSSGTTDGFGVYQ